MWPGARRQYGQASGVPAPGAVPSEPLGDGCQEAALILDGVGIGAYPSGYSVDLPGVWNLPQPVPVSRDPAVGVFIPWTGAGLTLDRRQTGYVPAWFGDGAIGVAPIGMLAIGYLRASHGTLVEEIVNGYPVLIDQESVSIAVDQMRLGIDPVGETA